MGYIDNLKEYMEENLEELRALFKARRKFNDTFRWLYGDTPYTPPKEIASYYWQFCLNGHCVEAETETECYVEMAKRVKEEINSLLESGELTLPEFDEFPF